MTCLSDKNNWEEICAKIQKRSQSDELLQVKNAKFLRTQILQCLTLASNEKVLKTNINEIHDLLKLSQSSVVPKKGYTAITGGEKNQHHRLDIPHFKLHNGYWFDFAITIDETCKPAKIIGFNFEIRLRKKAVRVKTSSHSAFRKRKNLALFLRIDLSLPNHHNDERGLRFHLHPNSGDIIIPSLPMSPLDILHMFLYGMKPRNDNKPRSS